MKKLLFVLILCVTVKAANTELQDLAELTAIANTDVLYVVDDPAGTPASRKITALNLFDMIDTFAELNAITADKTLVNEEDAVTWDALGTFNLGITITTADPFTLGTNRIDNGSDLIDGEMIAADTIDDDSIDFGDVTGVDLTLTDCGAITSTGTITATVGFDIVGAADMDYGSIDVLDHTFTTNDCTIIFDGGITVSTGDTITLGSTVWNSGDEIDGTVIKDADYGDIDVSAGGAWTLDTDTVAVAEFLASQDWGDMSTAADGTVSLDPNTVAASELAAADYGDWTISAAGVVTLDPNTVAASELAAADYGDWTISAAGVATLDADVVSTAEMADADHGDFTYSGGSATLDTGVVADNEIDYTNVTGADLTLTDAGAITSTGTITATVGFDIVGAADMDYGSIDVLDHTFTTNDCTIIFDGGITVSTGDTITLGSTAWNSGDSIDGEQIAADTIDNDSIDWADMTDLDTDGAVIWGNIAEGELADSTVISADIKDGVVTEVDLNVSNTPGAGEDNYVLTYNHAATNFTWAADATGGNTAWDDISDPDNSGLTTITFDNAEATLLTGDNDAVVSFLTIQNSDADHTVGNMYLLDLDYSADDGDVDADFIKCQDSGGVVFTVQENGIVAGSSFTDGTATLTGGALTGLTTALTVAQGGTGATSLSDGFVLLGNATGAIQVLDVTTDGGIIIGDGTTDPVVLDVGSSTAITILGTIATGVWQGTAIADGYIPNDITIDLATLATTLTITDNESTAENNPIVFVAGGDLDGGDLGLETDGDLHYNSSTGTVTAEEFIGGGVGITGVVASHTGTITWGGTSILESGAAFQFGDGTDATLTHTYANTGTNVSIAYSTAAMAVTGALTATNLSGTNTGDNTDAETGDSATAFFDTGTIEHEWGGLQADISAYTGLIAITGADTTAEIDAKSELEGQIADVADFAEADGDTWTGVHDAGGATSFEIPNIASGDLTLGTEGQLGLKSHEDGIAYHSGATGEISGEVFKSHLQMVHISVDPGTWYDSDTQICLFDVQAKIFPNGIIIDYWEVDCLLDPDVEMDVNLGYANDWDDIADPNLIDVLDTTAGKSSEDTDANINGGTAIAAGSVLFLYFDADPEGTCVQMIFEFIFHGEED